MCGAIVAAQFSDAFDRAPTVIASAPGRVNLIGEHVDYCGGPVLPIAIGRRTHVAIAPSEGKMSRAISIRREGVATFSLQAEKPDGEWWDYLVGVLRAAAGSTEVPDAIDVAVWSNLPENAGLSSSAALCVATAAAITANLKEESGRVRVADLAHQAESDWVGVPVGLMDQYVAALAHEGHALLLETDLRRWEHLPVNSPVMVFDTGRDRTLRKSPYAERRAECEEATRLVKAANPAVTALARATADDLALAKLPAPLDRRARHVVEESARVHAFADALRADGSMRGDLLLQSHESLRENFDCSSPEQDWFVERVMKVPGVTGARMTGGGWGGCAIAVGDDEALTEALTALADEFEAKFGRDSRGWVTRAHDGVRFED
jgi:galactokinase